MNYQISPHFTISELVSSGVLYRFGANAVWFLDQRIITYCEFMRERFGVAYANNWYWHGKQDSRGFRADDDADGGTMSQHRYGRAVDLVFKLVAAEEVRNDIIANWSRLYRPLGISCIEAEVAWVHADMRYIPGQKELLIIYP